MNTSMHQLVFIAMAFSSIPFAFVSAATSWGYDEPNGPSTWAGQCQTGQRQSPVNIVQTRVRKSAKLGTLEFGNYNEAGTVEVENNGHGGKQTIIMSFFHIQKERLNSVTRKKNDFSETFSPQYKWICPYAC
jgi:carbonic anhydrase